MAKPSYLGDDVKGYYDPDLDEIVSEVEMTTSKIYSTDQPSFLVYGTAGAWRYFSGWNNLTGGGTGNYSSGGNLNFAWSATATSSRGGAHNRGSHFSTSTGIFTAPVDGLYTFNFSTYGLSDNNENTYSYINGCLNGSVLVDYTMHVGMYGQGYQSGTVKTWSLYLSENDLFSPVVYANSGNSRYYSDYTRFGGYLVG